MTTLWNSIATVSGRSLTPAQIDQFSRYLDLLDQANQKINLTRITDRAAAEVQHIADSLTLLPCIPDAALRLADVGSGGGVPGIPLAIALPHIQVELIESTRKKASFLAEAASALGLANVTVSALRAEEAARGTGRGAFDVVTARAVATLDFLAEYCLPLLKKGGLMLAMKGARITEELPAAKRAIRLLGGGEPIIHPVSLPGVDNHVIVEIRKIAPTDSRFPRPPTEQKGRPIH